MKTTLNQSATIFWKGIKCKYVFWKTLNLGGFLKIRLNKRTIEVNISELTN